MDDFLIKYHPWSLLLEASAFPDNDEIIVMKGVMDGNSFGDIGRELDIKVNDVKQLLANGMKKVNANNLYELIVFGLRSGIIKDKPIDVKSIEQDFYKKGFYEGYPLWLYLLNQIATGKTFQDIEREGGAGSKTSIQHARKQIADKYGLGDSLAKYIRFAFAAVNPLTGPGYTRGYKPHVSWAQKAGIGSKLPLMPSKFQPSNIDPTIKVYNPLTLRDMTPFEREQKIKAIRAMRKSQRLSQRDNPSQEPKKTVPPPVVKSTSIQTALWLLGIDRNAITNQNMASGSFWNRPPEHLWNLLALAKRRFELEIVHAHPDRGGDVRRAVQLNAAWHLVKKLFARRGYVLHGK
jgi:DNA-binding CsgD family transcriptional regulator